MRHISSHTSVTIVCSLSPEEFWETETPQRYSKTYPFRVERIHISVNNGESLFGSRAALSGPLIKVDGETGLVRKYGEITVGELPEPIRDRIVGEFEQKRRLWRRPERQANPYEAIRQVLEDHQPTGDPCRCCGTYACTCFGGPSGSSENFDVHHVMEEIDKAVERAGIPVRVYEGERT